MPIEFVKATIEAPKRHFIPLDHHALSSGHPIFEEDPDHLHLPKDESRIDQANSDLRQTMTEIEEIKMYRSVKPRRAISAQQSTKPDTKRKVLVGAEFNRFIVSKEKAKIDKININLKRFQDPILEVLASSQQAIEEHVHEAKVIGYRSHQLHKGANRNNLETQRKQLLSQSEQRRKQAKEHPQHVHELEALRPQDDYVTWALDSSIHQESKLENELMQLETSLRKEVNRDVLYTSSSEDEQQHKRKGHLLKKPTKTQQRNKRKEDDDFHTNGRVREDVGAKLQQELNQLDRSLYRDLIRKSQAHKHPVHHSRLMGGKRFVGRRGKPHFNMKGAGASGSLARQGSHSSIGSARSGRSGPIFSHHDSFTSQSDAGYDEEEDNAERSERAATEYTGGAKIVKNEDLIKMNQKKQQFEASLRQFGGVDRDGSLKGNDSTDNGADNQSQTITVESMYKGESRPVSTMMFSAHPPVSAGQSANHRNTHVNFTNSPSRATLPNSSRAGLHPHPPHPSATGSATTPHRPTRPSVAHTPSSASRGVSSYGRKITTPSKDVRPLPQETSPPHGNSAEHDNASHIPPELHIDSRHLDDGESMQHFLLRQNHTFKRNHIHDVVEDQDAVEKAEANHEHNHHHQHGHHHKPDVKISVLQDSHSFGSQDAMDPVLMPDGQVMNGATDVSVLVFGESNGVPVLLATHDIVQEVKDPATESEPKTSTEEAEAAQDEVDHNILRKMNLIENMMQTAQQKKLQAKLAAEAEAEKIAMYSDDPAKRPGDAFRDDFLHENRPTTQYFVSSIHTLASKASKSTGVEEIKPLPYRDRELKSKHMKKHVSKTVSTVQASVGDQSQILQLEHLTCNLAEKRELPPVLERDNNKIVSGFKDKLQGEEMLEEFRNLHVNKASIIEARRARKAIEADMSVVRDVVVSVTKKSAERTKQLKDHLQSIVTNKENRLGEAIQSLKDKEFHSPRKFKERRQQFKTLDEKLMTFLDYKVPSGTTTFYDMTHRKEEDKAAVGSSSEEENEEEDSEESSGGDRFPSQVAHHREVFLTQMRGKPQALSALLAIGGGSTSSSAGGVAGGSGSVSASATSSISLKKGSTAGIGQDAAKAVPLLLTQNNLASLIRQFAEQQQHKGQLNAVRQTLHNDLSFCHNYELQFRKVVQRNQAKENTQAGKRILSKGWFLQLLRRIKKYKKSVFNAKIPPSLFLLLGSVKKLIGANVDITKESLWQLIEKTIQKDEFKQNLIYIALQQIFTEVHVHPEEIYHHLRNQHIEIAPKLLMDVKRERKMKQMRDKLIAQSKKTHKHHHHHAHHIVPKSMPVLHEDGELEIAEDQDSPNIRLTAGALAKTVSLDSSDGVSVHSDADTGTTDGNRSFNRNASQSSMNSDLSVEDGLDVEADNFDYEAWLKDD